MSFLREWRAEIRRATSADYVEYVRRTGIAEYRRTPEDSRYLLTRPDYVRHYQSSDIG